jgi:acyl carrier protein
MADPMHRTIFAQQVRSFLVADYLFGQDDKLEDDTSFLDAGIIDSTGVLQLIAFLERTFGIRVNDEELTPDNLDSISNISAYLSRKLHDGVTPNDSEVLATASGEAK